ncbi:MAG: HEAT repeat domain-containing protein [Deltaproteobacteria bacterium]|nr:HEAT repeat domain-containing protein [Deltaproteobacteria bacterium]
MGTRQLKKEILRLLTNTDFQENLATLKNIPARQAVNPLFSFFYATDPIIKWHAVTAMGQVVSNLANENMESARVIMRRLVWNLNDESGGIGWGSPEAMGEIMANHKKLAEEYHRLLVSYIRPDGNFLEHKELQKGLLWGLARLAGIRPELGKDAGPFLVPYLESADAEHRGLAAMAAGALKEESARNALERIFLDRSVICVYRDRRFERISVGRIAENALTRF